MSVTEIQKRAAPILKRHGAVEAYLFGSTARGEDTLASDVDILVQFDKIIGLLEHVRTKHELEDALGRKVDLVQAKALKLEMKSSVEKDSIKIV